MSLACCPKCCSGRRNVVMACAHPHLPHLSVPSPLIACAPCIWGPPNPHGQVWPAQRGHWGHPCQPWVLGAPSSSVGKHRSPGWHCADTRALFLVIQVVFVLHTLNSLKQLWKPQPQRLLYNYLTTNLMKALQLTG